MWHPRTLTLRNYEAEMLLFPLVLPSARDLQHLVSSQTVNAFEVESTLLRFVQHEVRQHEMAQQHMYHLVLILSESTSSHVPTQAVPCAIFDRVFEVVFAVF
jgi:hypothetical protein